MSVTVHTIGAIITLQALDTAVVNELINTANQINPELGAYVSLTLKLTIFVLWLYVNFIKSKKNEKQ